MSIALCPVASPLTLSAPMRPRTNPLRVVSPGDPIAPGASIACVLGESTRSARGHRVVQGTVVGTAVRQMGRALDIELEGVSTWVHDIAPMDLQVLEPSFHPVFRVAVIDDIATTIALLRGDPVAGRSKIPVAEIPFRTCWRCGKQAGTRDVFCGDCSRRLRVGPVGGRPDTFTNGSCPACWGQPGSGRACTQCGAPRQISARLAARLGQTVSLVITGGHKRHGSVKARIVEIRRQRLSRDGAAAWVLVLDSIVGAGALGVADARARVAVQLVMERAERVTQDVLADVLERGVDLKAADIVAPCPICQKRKTQGARVWTPWCPDCGGRVRLLPHAAWRERTARRSTLTHSCGKRAWGSYCGSCGEETGSGDDERFSTLSLEPSDYEAAGSVVADPGASPEVSPVSRGVAVIDDEDIDLRFEGLKATLAP